MTSLILALPEDLLLGLIDNDYHKSQVSLYVSELDKVGSVWYADKEGRIRGRRWREKICADLFTKTREDQKMISDIPCSLVWIPQWRQLLARTSGHTSVSARYNSGHPARVCRSNE